MACSQELRRPRTTGRCGLPQLHVNYLALASAPFTELRLEVRAGVQQLSGTVVSDTGLARMLKTGRRASLRCSGDCEFVA